jgi:hypothetical protein
LLTYEKTHRTYSSIGLLICWVGTNECDQYHISSCTSPQFPNNTETASEFADVIEGNDTTIIENDTNIGNTNNTLPDSTDVNIREDCMQVPGQSEPYCP